ncbi:MAG: DUF6804 family protein [Acidobacteriota bacterium]
MKVIFSRPIYLCVAAIALAPPIASLFNYVLAYGVFQLLRVAVTLGAICALVAAVQSDRLPLVPLFAVIAIVFNPIAPLRFDKYQWRIIDSIAGMIFIVWAVLVRRPRVEEPAGPPILPTLQAILLLILLSVAVDIRDRLHEDLPITGSVTVDGTVDVSGSVSINDYDEPISVRLEQ